MKNILTQLLNNKREIKPSRRSAIRNLPLVIMCGIFLVAGCSSVGKFLPSGDSGSGANQSNANANQSNAGTNQSSVNSKPAASTSERQLQVASVRPLNYANLQYTLTKAVISDRETNDLPPDNSKPAIADLTFSVVNTLKDGVPVEDAMWQLKLGDGSVYKQLYHVYIQGRDTQESTIHFRVPEAAQWTGAQLTLDEQDKEPATMILDGNSPPPQYPAQLPTGGTAATKDPALTYTIQNANLDLDGNGKRVALGKHFLNLTVHTTCQNETDVGLSDLFRLSIDGAPLAPEHQGDNNYLKCPGSEDFPMTYLIPANAANVALEIGTSGSQDMAKIPIDLKAVSQ